jgi:hypothetical protein
MNFNFLSLDRAKNVWIARPDPLSPPSKSVLCFERVDNGPLPGDYDKEHLFQIDAISKFLVHCDCCMQFEMVFDF